MPQFLIPPERVADDRFTLEGDEAYHMVRVMRYGAQDVVELFDGRGRRYRARIDKILDSHSVEGTILERIEAPVRRLELNLYFAMIQKERLEDVIIKGTEIGVSRFFPILTERTEVKFRESARNFKMERWRKMLVTASKQCGRPKLPEIGEPQGFQSALTRAIGGDVFLCDLTEDAQPLGIMLKGFQEKQRTVNLFIGPEGGFSPAEVAEARRLGVRIASLGRHTLRSETACISGATLVLLSEH